MILTWGGGGGDEKMTVDLSFATEITIEIKQFNFGRMASHPLIESIWCSH